ncbi:SMAD/FHA domain-containing protein [Artemisia annua]|uniref:SMAD/FHA domain-containing protein n=1 Tax=Artemisia annua TaxID=35608 RepID=A0A2U1PLN8_ARTAN|nr:SMAD/FHA domain-containing protein [Artemisia annua]
MDPNNNTDVEAGFAKLQGEDFEYYMQTYSIILGRTSKKSTVDVDLSSLGGGMNISRHHARIFYDFKRRRFALEVLGKNGCLVEGVLHLPGAQPVKLDSQDLLQIGDKEFYFLLPVRSVLSGRGTRRAYEEEEDVEGSGSGKRMRIGGGDGYGYGPGVGASGSGGMPVSDRKSEGRARVDRESDNQQLLQLEEKDVVSSVATVLSDLCGPGEWMPMEKLHAELVEQYGSLWHHSRVRKYLTSEDYPSPEAKVKPWFGLLMLLRKYPEHFVINTRSKGRVTLEFVSLVSLIS